MLEVDEPQVGQLHEGMERKWEYYIVFLKILETLQ